MALPEAPPTARPPPPPVRTTWPSTLGAVAIGLGVLGALGSLLGLLAVAFQRKYLGLFGAAITDDRALQILANSPHPLLSGGLQVSGVLAGSMLTVAGVRLVRRRRSAVPLLRLWAVLKMILVLAGVLTGIRVTAAAFQASASPAPPGLEMATMTLSIVMGVLLGWALPVFSLVWLRREKVRAEIAGWPLA